MTGELAPPPDCDVPTRWGNKLNGNCNEYATGWIFSFYWSEGYKAQIAYNHSHWYRWTNGNFSLRSKRLGRSTPLLSKSNLK